MDVHVRMRMRIRFRVCVRVCVRACMFVFVFACMHIFDIEGFAAMEFEGRSAPMTQMSAPMTQMSAPMTQMMNFRRHSWDIFRFISSCDVLPATVPQWWARSVPAVAR
jgi:hypothetical protein